jgi:hypothetical protein
MTLQEVLLAVTPLKNGVQKFLASLDSGACPGSDLGSVGMREKGFSDFLRVDQMYKQEDGRA